MKVVLFAAIALFATAPAAASGLEGSWTNPARSITVKIGPCGATQCGRVTSASAKARADAAYGGTERLLGIELISGIEPAGPGRWRAEIFVPDQNIHSSGELALTGPNRMVVRGCVIGGLICKEQVWTRAAAVKRRKR
ncbi:MAG: DUF2147 domain-containing protein [Pseudomonadota bacterium]